MKCEICQAFFTVEMTFSTLFSLPRFCPVCLQRYQPGWHRERIPFAMGIIDYFSIYSFENEDYRQDTWLFKNMDKCFKMAVFGQSFYDLTIILGEQEFEQAAEWLPFIRGNKHVLFLSLFYYDFIPFEDFL